MPVGFLADRFFIFFSFFPDAIAFSVLVGLHFIILYLFLCTRGKTESAAETISISSRSAFVQNSRKAVDFEKMISDDFCISEFKRDPSWER